MANQPSNQSRLAAYCSAKGRMLASFQSLRPAADTFWLITDLSVLPATLKRLSMFVLRAKVKLQDGAESLAAVGLIGAAAADVVAGQAPGSVWADAAHGGLWTRLPDVSGLMRCLWIGPKDQQQGVLAAYPALDWPVGSGWTWSVVWHASRQQVLTSLCPRWSTLNWLAGSISARGVIPAKRWWPVASTVAPSSVVHLWCMVGTRWQPGKNCSRQLTQGNRRGWLSTRPPSQDLKVGQPWLN